MSQTYPTLQNNGIGLHTYHTSNLVETPTLILTRATQDTYLPEAKHVCLKPISFIQYPFPKNRKENLPKFLLALGAYGLGQLEFFAKSIPSLVSFKPDIVHLQSPHAILIGLFAKLFLGSKLVITFHGSDLRRIKKNWLFLRLLRLADKIFYVSSSMHDLLAPHFSSSQLVHTPSGIDLDFFLDFKQQERENIILAVGNLRWQKDYPNLIKSLQIVFRQLPEFRAVIIGSGPDEAALKSLAQELGLSDKISFLGQQPKEIVRKYLYTSKVFVLSSVSEGMPKAVLEALVTSTPVVSTAVGAIPEILASRGLVAEVQNPTALGNALISALSGGISQEMITSGKQLALHFSWSDLASILKREFDLLLACKTK